MTDTNAEGTEVQTGEAPAEQGTPKVATDEVTTLRSRNAGLDAKVSTLIASSAAEKQRADAAEARLRELLDGAAATNEDFGARLRTLEAERDEALKLAKSGLLASKYPETYKVFGDAVAGMSDAALAEAEARFVGVAAESNIPPTPVANNVTRPQQTTTKSIEEMSLAELKEYGAQAFVGLTWDGITQS